MKKKIYITDDDPGVQDILRLIFESAGYDITVYNNGFELLKNITTYPDVYILDKNLSGLDGLDICRNLKNNNSTKKIPVIMISATPGIGIMARDAGADNFIEKPFKKIELLNMVAKYVA